MNYPQLNRMYNDIIDRELDLEGPMSIFEYANYYEINQLLMNNRKNVDQVFLDMMWDIHQIKRYKKLKKLRDKWNLLKNTKENTSHLIY